MNRQKLGYAVGALYFLACQIWILYATDRYELGLAIGGMVIGSIPFFLFALIVHIYFRRKASR